MIFIFDTSSDVDLKPIEKSILFSSRSNGICTFALVTDIRGSGKYQKFCQQKIQSYLSELLDSKIKPSKYNSDAVELKLHSVLGKEYSKYL